MSAAVTRIDPPKPLSILLYNYVQPNEAGSAGGGIAVYMRNLLSTFRKHGHRVWTVSSGDRYDLFGRQPRLGMRSEYEYVIYNSPVVAPAVFSFYHPEVFLESDLLNPIATQLANEIGELDVIHFHNIEGLTFGFFETIRRLFPRSAMLYSAHNYNIGCSQVNLWQHGAKACDDYADGFACVECCAIADGRARKIFVGRLKTPVKNLAGRLPGLARKMSSLDKLAKKLSERYVNSSPFHAPDTQIGFSGTKEGPETFAFKAKLYREFRTAGAQLVNEVFDQTIAVSTRTAGVLQSFGADPKRIRVCYIGTKHAERLLEVKRKAPISSNLHIAYLGYMRTDKGFYYFLSNLRKLPVAVRSTIDVSVAAKFTDSEAVASLNEISSSFRSFNCYDGYSHEDLGNILAPVNLGVVPPLWEDNLPQVAIEFVTHGIPILTSNRGGASEIASNSRFVFDVGSPSALAEKLVEITDGRLDMAEFWSKEPNIRSNEQHVQELIDIYHQVLQLRRGGVTDCEL